MTFYFDENFSEHLAYALHCLEKTGGKISIESTVDCVGRGATDEQVVKHIIDNDGVLFTKDNDFRRVKLLRELIQDSTIGLVYYTSGSQDYWETVRTIINIWPKLRKDILKRNGKFIIKLQANGKYQFDT